MALVGPQDWNSTEMKVFTQNQNDDRTCVENVIFFYMKAFVSVLFQSCGPTRHQWLQLKTKKNRSCSSRDLAAYIKIIGWPRMTSIQIHAESKVYRSIQFWRYHENLEEIIFQSMQYRIFKSPIFTEKIVIKKMFFKRALVPSYWLTWDTVANLRHS